MIINEWMNEEWLIEMMREKMHVFFLWLKGMGKKTLKQNNLQIEYKKKQKKNQHYFQSTRIL